MNVDAYRIKHPAVPLSIAIDGRVFSARRASYRAVCQFEAAKNKPGRFARALALRRFLRSCFPFHWSHLRPGTDPVAAILRLTSVERGKVLMALLGHAAANDDEQATAKLKQLEAFLNG